MQDPQSLHKYLYVHGDPVNMTDPSGLFGVGGMVVSIGIALGNVSTELVAGGLIVSMLETGGKAGFGAREAGLILIANGEFDSGIRLYHLGVRVIGLTFATIDSVDTAIGLGALGIGLAFAAYKIARHAPDLAQSALNFSRKALDKFSDAANSVDNTLSLFARLEDNARRWLDAFQNSSKTSSNAHFFSRHGAQTTNAQQYTRATTGVTPDGFAGNPVNSARFLTHREQLNALHSALEINQRTGKKVFTFDAGYTVGEGYMKNGVEFRTTTNVTAVFDSSGKLKTLYPNLNPLP